MLVEYKEMYPSNYKNYIPIMDKIGALLTQEQLKLMARVDDDNHRIVWEEETRFLVVSEKSTIGYFYLEQLPGCCGVIVLFNMSVGALTRLGIGTLLNELAKEIAKVHGYTVMLATDKHVNIPQRKILAKNNWKDIHQFRNKRTENVIDISVVDL